MQKTRVATPTKLSMTQRLQNAGLTSNTSKNPTMEKRSSTINQIASKLDNDLEEEELTTNSGRTTPSSSRQKFYESSQSPQPRRARHGLASTSPPKQDDSPRNNNNNIFKTKTHSNSDSPPNHHRPLVQARSISPKDSLNLNESDDFAKSLYEKHTKTISNLLSKLYFTFKFVYVLLNL